MNTDVFREFEKNISHLLGHINSLDLLAQFAQEKISELKKTGKNPTFVVHGVDPKEQIKYDKILGVVKIQLSDADKLINFVVMTTCKNSLVSLVAIVEDYLKSICYHIIQTKPEVFKSAKELKLTYKEIIELKNNQNLIDKMLNKIISGLTRNNIADSFKELFAKQFGWDINHLKKELTLLKDTSAERNIIVHNQSKVNQKFLSVISEPNKYKIDDEIIIGPKGLRKRTYSTIDVVKKFDDIVVSKI